MSDRMAWGLVILAIPLLLGGTYLEVRERNEKNMECKNKAGKLIVTDNGYLCIKTDAII